MLANVCIVCIKMYQYCISPFLPSVCRFYPSCSTYAIQAIQVHGVLKGLWLSVKRVVRCNPYCSCGVDLVPAKDR